MNTHRSLALTLGLMVLGSASSFADDGLWLTDYKTARQEAAGREKLLVIEFTSAQCSWCRKLESDTFASNDIAEILKRDCIPLRLDGHREPALMEALNIRSYPTVILASPDGHILGRQEGFVASDPFKKQLVKAKDLVEKAAWLEHDYQEASQALADSNIPHALEILKGIAADGKDRPIQVKAGQLIQEIERQAQDRLAHAQLLAAKGRSEEAAEALKALKRNYEGTSAAQKADDVKVYLAAKKAPAVSPRANLARDLLTRARENMGAGQYVACLDICETVVRDYADLPEAGEAVALAADVKENPEYLKKACEHLSDRLGTFYLAQAEAWLRRGRRDQAQDCLEQVIRLFPTTRNADVAQVRLRQLRGQASNIQIESEKP